LQVLADVRHPEQAGASASPLDPEAVEQAVIAALVLAGVCAWPPLYGELVGPACPPAEEGIECKCSECLPWSPAANATSYAVERTKVSTGEKVNVGTTARQSGVYIDADGNPVTWTVEAPPIWCVGRDSAMPNEGLLYEYRVKACNANGCSALQGAICPPTQVDRSNCPVQYRGAPYACFHNGVEVPCYTSDPLIDKSVCYRGTIVIPCPAAP